jgi:hypothetical protein
MKLFSIMIISILLLLPLTTYAHHKDGHDQGQGQNQGGGQSGNNPPDHANNDKDKDKIKDKNIGSGQGCSYITITNNASEYARCKIIDTVSPVVHNSFKSDNVLCVYVTDDTGIDKVYIIFISGSIELIHYSGSYNWYCSIVNEKIAYILAEDLAGNRGIRV